MTFGGCQWFFIKNMCNWEYTVAHLVFVYNPAPCVFVLALVESLIFDDLVHREMLEACRSC